MKKIIDAYKDLTLSIIEDRKFGDAAAMDAIKRALPSNLEIPSDIYCYGIDVDSRNTVVIVTNTKSKYAPMMEYLQPTDIGPVVCRSMDERWIHVIPYNNDDTLNRAQNLYNNFGTIFIMLLNIGNNRSANIIGMEFISKYAAVYPLILNDVINRADELVKYSFPLHEFSHQVLFTTVKSYNHNDLYDFIDFTHKSLKGKDNVNKYHNIKVGRQIKVEDTPSEDTEDDSTQSAGSESANKLSPKDIPRGAVFLLRFYWDGIADVYSNNRFIKDNKSIRVQFHERTNCYTCALAMESFRFDRCRCYLRSDALTIESLFTHINDCIDESANSKAFSDGGTGMISIIEYQKLINIKNAVDAIYRRIMTNFFAGNYDYNKDESKIYRFEDKIADMAIYTEYISDPDKSGSGLAVDFNILKIGEKTSVCTPEFENAIIKLRKHK